MILPSLWKGEDSNPTTVMSSHSVCMRVGMGVGMCVHACVQMDYVCVCVVCAGNSIHYTCTYRYTHSTPVVVCNEVALRYFLFFVAIISGGKTSGP